MRLRPLFFFARKTCVLIEDRAEGSKGNVKFKQHEQLLVYAIGIDAT